jgi:hypothetical protein
LFREIDINLSGWFGKSKKAKNIIREILKKLEETQNRADVLDEDVRKNNHRSPAPRSMRRAAQISTSSH